MSPSACEVLDMARRVMNDFEATVALYARLTKTEQKQVADALEEAGLALVARVEKMVPDMKDKF